MFEAAFGYEGRMRRLSENSDGRVGLYDQAVPWFRRAIEANRNFPLPHSCWPPPWRSSVALTRRVPRSRPASRSTRPSPSPATAPAARRGATTRRIWPGTSALSKACAKPDCRNNDRRAVVGYSLPDGRGRGGDGAGGQLMPRDGGYYDAVTPFLQTQRDLLAMPAGDPATYKNLNSGSTRPAHGLSRRRLPHGDEGGFWQVLRRSHRRRDGDRREGCEGRGTAPQNYTLPSPFRPHALLTRVSKSDVRQPLAKGARRRQTQELGDDRPKPILRAGSVFLSYCEFRAGHGAGRATGRGA